MIVKFEDGIYNGEMKNGRLHGLGIFTYNDGKVYDGEFSDGLFHGYGMFKWPDGTYYKGNYYKGKFHGLGVMRFSNGTIYEGEFFDNKLDGYGLLIYVDGEISLCEYEESKMVEYSIYNEEKETFKTIKLDPKTMVETVTRYSTNFTMQDFDNILGEQISMYTAHNFSRCGKSYIDPVNKTQKIAYDFMNIILKGTEQIKPRKRLIQGAVQQPVSNVNKPVQRNSNHLNNVIFELQARAYAVDYYNHAIGLRNKGQYRIAIQYFEKAKGLFRNYPDRLDCDNNIAECRKRLSKTSYSGTQYTNNTNTSGCELDEYETSQDVSNKKAEEYFRSANSCYNCGNYSQAIEYYEQAMSLSYSSKMREDCAKNIEWCKRGINEEKCQEAHAEYERAIWYYDRENWREAELRFEKALELMGDNDYTFTQDCNDRIRDCWGKINNY